MLKSVGKRRESEEGSQEPRKTRAKRARRKERVEKSARKEQREKSVRKATKKQGSRGSSELEVFGHEREQVSPVVEAKIASEGTEIGKESRARAEF